MILIRIVPIFRFAIITARRPLVIVVPLALLGSLLSYHPHSRRVSSNSCPMCSRTSRHYQMSGHTIQITAGAIERIKDVRSRTNDRPLLPLPLVEITAPLLDLPARASV